MDYAKIVRTKASLESIDKFLDEVRKELDSDQREEVVDELLEALTNEVLLIRVNLLGTLKLDESS